MAADLVRRYLATTRQTKAVDVQDTLSKAVGLVAKEMTANFHTGDDYARRVEFAQIHSAQCECEMYGSTMLIDLNFVRLMWFLNALWHQPVQDREIGRIAADYLAEAYLACGRFAETLHVARRAAAWRQEEKKSLFDGPHDYELLLMQLHFLVLHESYHWVFAHHPELRRGAEEEFERVVKPVIIEHVGKLLDAANVNWAAIGPHRANGAIAYLNDMRTEVEKWVGSGREELICDLWAIDGVVGPLAGESVVKALLAGATVHTHLECKDFLSQLAALGEGFQVPEWGLFGAPRAGARFVLFRGLCETICNSRSKEFDRIALQGRYVDYQQRVERMMDAAVQLDRFIHARQSQPLAAPVDGSGTLRSRALAALGYPTSGAVFMTAV